MSSAARDSAILLPCLLLRDTKGTASHGEASGAACTRWIFPEPANSRRSTNVCLRDPVSTAKSREDRPGLPAAPGVLWPLPLGRFGLLPFRFQFCPFARMHWICRIYGIIRFMHDTATVCMQVFASTFGSGQSSSITENFFASSNVEI